MSLSPLTFVGISKFSADLQTILNRAQQVASFPLQSLQNDRTDLIQKKTLTMTLQSLAGELSNSLQKMADTGDAKGIQGTSSRPSAVSINSVSGSTAANYTISDITSIAKAASETSVSGYASSGSTPVSATGHLRLTVGSDTHDIFLAPDRNHLTGLRDAINQLGAGVTATIFTTGTGADPNFLSVSFNTTGATTLSLQDDPEGSSTSLLTSVNQGSNAEFKLNGVLVSRPRNLINDVIAGVSFTIAETTSGSETTTLSLSSSRSQLSSSLTQLVNAYNNMVDFLDTQIGPSAGLLSGSSLISGMASSLRQLTSFQGSGNIRSLSELGLELDNAGKLSLNQEKLTGLNDAQLSSAFEFLGSAPHGLGSMVQQFRSFSDPVTGLVKTELDQFGITENRLKSQISTLTERIQQQQAALQSRLQFADTLLASLESQQSMLNAQLESLNLTLYGRKNS